MPRRGCTSGRSLRGYRIFEELVDGDRIRHLVHYPLHRGEIYNLVAVFHSDRYEEGWDSYGDPEELNARFQGEHEATRAGGHTVSGP